MKLIFCVIVTSQLFVSLLFAQPRQVQSLNEHWLYLEEEIIEPGRLKAAKQSWQKIRLPHTWNRWDVLDNVPGYRRGVSWYRKEIVIPSARNDSRFILSFEGVNMKSDVFVNGRRAGGHIGGYIGFEIDITPFVTRGAKNTLLVKADNGIDPNIIPSQKSDFFLYGGITRNVWLRVVPSRYMSLVKISTPNVSKERAETSIDVEVENGGTSIQGEVEAIIKDSNGNRMVQSARRTQFPSGKSVITVPLPAMKGPSLWSPDHPTLYTAFINLKSSGKTIDSHAERFGYRWFEFKEHGPFFLNGERLLLRGTHRHEEWSGYGNALPDSLHRREMKMIKEMGANFVRLGHYPQAPEVYRACDELGLLVWGELPWCRGGMGGDEWKSNTKRMLHEMIRQNFNHPSIIIWSLGNELDWLPDFPGGDNHDSLRGMLTVLNSIAHHLDPHRLTAMRRFDEGADRADVHSSSIWMGWYSSSFGYRNYENAINDARKKFKWFVHAEYGGDSHVGRHNENPVGGDGMLLTPKGKEKMLPVAANSDWSENYIVDLMDWHLNVSERSDSLSGNVQWIFKDFGTPLRPENPIPYVNQKGLCDIAGNPKDAYYVYKSYWSDSPKFCYIESHTWTERSGPAQAMREVNVYSNAAEVELKLNGVSQGRLKRDIRKFPACGLSWQVGFVEGQNRLVAIGWENGTSVTRDSIQVRYTYRHNEPAADVKLSTENLPNGNVLITAIAVDKTGQRCLDYNKRIYFSKMGAGELLSGYGTPTRSNTIEMANGKAQIEFIPALNSRTIIEARNQDFKSSIITIPALKE